MIDLASRWSYDFNVAMLLNPRTLGARVHVNLSPAALYEHAIRRGEGVVAAHGPLVCRTGVHTGRSPLDKFIVREPSSDAHIAWGSVNRPMSVDHFETLRADMLASVAGKELAQRKTGSEP